MRSGRDLLDLLLPCAWMCGLNESALKNSANP
jgi:hypothetical protein